jgi:hypothetical protein
MRRAAARKSIYITSQLANLRIYIIKEWMGGVGDQAYENQADNPW